MNIKSDKLIEKTINLVVITFCVSLATNLFTLGFSQKIFYLASYACFFLTIFTFFKCFSRINEAKFYFIFAGALLSLGLIRLGWSLYIKHTDINLTENALGILDNYFLGGKRILLGSFIISALAIHGSKVKLRTICLCKGIIIAGVVLTLLFGAYEYFYITHARIKLTADAASSSSYMVIFIYCTYLWFSHFTSGRLWQGFDLLFAFVLFLVVLMCGTRISFVAFLVISLLHFSHVYDLRVILKKKRNIFIVLFTILILMSLTNERWREGINDIKNYHSNSSTSIGARFAIWSSGFYFMSHHSGFSSPDERTIVAREYIERNQSGNYEGFNNVKYNMHNEFLEVTTLQGWLGLCSLLFFYLVVLMGKMRRNDLRGIILPVVALFIMGLTDSVLIYAQTVMMLIIALGCCSIKPHNEIADTGE